MCLNSNIAIQFNFGNLSFNDFVTGGVLLNFVDIMPSSICIFKF